MGSKEPIQRMILLQWLKYQISALLVLIQAETKILQLHKNFTNFVTKERPLGGFERSKSHFGQQITFFSVRPDKGHSMLE